MCFYNSVSQRVFIKHIKSTDGFPMIKMEAAYCFSKLYSPFDAGNDLGIRIVIKLKPSA